VDVEGSSVISGLRDKAHQHEPDKQFIAKIERAMRCRSVVRREVGLKCCDMHGCCVGGRLGVRSCLSMVQVAASTKTNRVGAAARQS